MCKLVLWSNVLCPDLRLHSIAGVDTTSTSLSYFFWELTRRPDIMRNLQAELDQHMFNRQTIPDFGTLCKLPYLNAFIREGSFIICSTVPLITV